MVSCPACGRDLPEQAPFCPFCHAVLTAAPGATHEQRKIVTIVFCDVVGSTALGESVDPEALRALLARYFERMKGIVERHGGTVEKFIGDAVMAVFGVPVAHEDDALRALRAAAEMRDALPELGIEARIGVNTGEVVTGADEVLATGDAVNVAARLEQAAQSGEVLIGHETRRLASDSVDLEPVEPLQLKGKSEPVPAYRLLGVRETPERSQRGKFVGREDELTTLVRAWARVQAERSCELVTLVADAGVGKTRLAAEALARMGARAVRGRCLSYGEGITYWPVIEVIKQLSGLPTDAAAAAALRSLLGESNAGTSAEEIAWAFRKLLEEEAQKRPLVVCFEDVHWGEETFLDLVEHVALLSAGAPILLLCTARPELLDRRPTWPVTLRLGPLAADAVEELIPVSIEGGLRERILHAAGGNPLFVTEMVAIADEAEGEVTVPPTLRALLATRLDQLDSAERIVLERGAIEGELFHRGAVNALTPADTPVTPRLAALVRRELIRPDTPQLAGEDGFRFRHLLIRDAAYDALPKALRAELHERFAVWLEQHGQGLVELDEILGHHLEQASRYKTELGQRDDVLSDRAGELLAVAGRRALWRGDESTARGLLTRALELTRPNRLDVGLELDLSFAWMISDSPEAAAIAGAAADRAQAAGDEAGEAVARVAAATYRLMFAADMAIDELERLADKALPLLEQALDHAGLVYVWVGLANVAAVRGGFEETARAEEQALRHSRLAGQRYTHLFFLEECLVTGPRPADEALDTLDRLASDHPHPRVVLMRASLLAMLGRFEEAWPIAHDAAARVREVTGHDGDALALAEIAVLAGDLERAVAEFRRGCDDLEARNRRALLSSYAPMFACTLCALGRHDEAEPLARLGRELADETDVWAQADWRTAQALVDAGRGRYVEAESLAREAIALIETSDGLNGQADAYCVLADVLTLAGRASEAVEPLGHALDCFQRKRNLASAGRVQGRLDELRSSAAP